MLIFGSAMVSMLTTCQSSKGKKTYKPAWESLEQHPIPKWFADAKLGIYAHWGVYSVPAYDGPRYGKRMYVKGGNVYEYHKKHYGDPSEFGYKDFIPMFKAEKFDPEGWAELLKKAGAKFAGICVAHHDGFAM